MLLGCDGHQLHPSVGKAFPNFRLQGLDGIWRTRADYVGQALVVNFLATWCPPCRAEMPDLETVYRRFFDRGLRVIGFSIDRLRGKPRPSGRGRIARTA